MGRAIAAPVARNFLESNLRCQVDLGRTSSGSVAPKARRPGFFDDFRRFFVRGLAAVLPTLITLWLLIWAWNFLWQSIGQHIVWGLRWAWLELGGWWVIPREPPAHIHAFWDENFLSTRLVGVGLAIVLVYIVGVLVGNFIGRQMWRAIEMAVLRVPLVRAIYPSVKQVTDWLLAEHPSQFTGSRVVAVQPHATGIWSIGLVTGGSLRAIHEAVGEEMVTVFIPSSPTAFSGYVLVVPRESLIELPLSVEEVMRLLVSGGVISPTGMSGPIVSRAVVAAEPPVAAPKGSQDSVRAVG